MMPWNAGFSNLERYEEFVANEIIYRQARKQAAKKRNKRSQKHRKLSPFMA